MSTNIEELGGSELGTKDYWERSYDSEIRNYKSHGDVGEVWFDEDSQLRVINWMLRKEIASDVSVIDLGKCGLVELYGADKIKIVHRLRQWHDVN